MNNIISLELGHFFFWLVLTGLTCFFVGMIVGAQEIYHQLRREIQKLMERKNEKEIS